MGTFTVNMDRLSEQVRGRWRAGCEVNQVYAHYQEVHPEFFHPDGGQAFYLRDTVYHGRWMEQIASGLIGEDGIDLERKMRGVADGMVQGVYHRAPVEFNDLRRSGKPYVTRDQAVVYEHPPLVGRLSEHDLRLKSRLRSIFDPNRYRR